jgi:Uncharacterized protein conserved in archaea
MSNYALLLSAGPDNAGSALNAIEYALRLDDAGHTVEIYLDGPATRWPAESKRRSGHPFSEGFGEAQKRGLVSGACAFCANAFGATEGCQEAEIELLGTAGEEHGPDVGAIAADGYELLTVG